MAKLQIMGDSIQIKSNITEDLFKAVERYYPEKLSLRNEANEEYFVLNIGNASIGKYGISFPNKDENGCLFVTSENPVHDHSDSIAEKNEIVSRYAHIMYNLRAIEGQIHEAEETIINMESSVEDSISFTE